MKICWSIQFHHLRIRVSKYILILLAGYLIWRKCRLPPIWTKVSDNEVILDWLKSEFEIPTHQFQWNYQKAARENISRPLIFDKSTLNDPDRCLDRRIVFNEIRGNFNLWAPIAISTTWYRVEITVPLPNWTITSFRHSFEFNCPMEIDTQIINIPSLETGKISHSIDGTVLWGHSMTGPWIVLDGNHRWGNWTRRQYRAQFYVGLSDQYYQLHGSSGCSKCK